MGIVKFKDVVCRANTKEDRFNTEKIYYVGGEHIDSNNVLITQKGLIEGSTIGPMFYFGFKEGQVLFVTRNPHLRKAGLVTFDGICSEKTFVLETKDESVLLQKYLPFVMQSNHFWNYMEAHKSGSVNFFINWSTLAEYEFDLPSIERQQEIADLLWSINDTKVAYEKMIDATNELVKSQFIEMFGDPVLNDKGWPTKPMKQVAPEYRASIPEEESYWWLNLDMIESFSGTIIEKVIEQKSNIGNSTAPFDNTMVMYSKLRPYLNKVTVPDGYGYATTELVGLKPDGNVLNKYFLFNLLRGDQFVKYAVGLSAGGQMPRMPMKEFRQFECILPPMELQEQFVELYKQSDKSKFELQKAIANLKQLQRTIIEENV